MEDNLQIELNKNTVGNAIVKVHQWPFQNDWPPKVNMDIITQIGEKTSLGDSERGTCTGYEI